jgi:eukaryotic-like serine/threonine-protein kinase
MIIIAFLMVTAALPSTTTNIIIYRQQQEALAQSNDDDNNNNTFKLYENITYGIKIEYPSNWTIEEEGDEDSDNVIDVVSFFAPVRNNSETVTPSLYITIDNPPLNLIENLNEYLRTTINDYNDSQDFQVIESNTNSSTLGGYPAYKLVYTDVDEDNINYKDMEIGTIIGDKVYLVTYDAAEEEYSVYLPTVQKMIDSLKITTSNN